MLSTTRNSVGVILMVSLLVRGSRGFLLISHVLMVLLIGLSSFKVVVASHVKLGSNTGQEVCSFFIDFAQEASDLILKMA